MFSQVRRAQSSSGMGFVGKSKNATKPRTAALVVELSEISAGNAEAAIKAGADGLLFAWDGQETSELETLKQMIDSAKASGENVVCGLELTGSGETLERDSLEKLKETGVNYVVLPFDAPARLLSLKIKDLDLVVTVPMRSGDMYPSFIRNLTAFDTITAVRLDFPLTGKSGTMTIEDALHYRAVREAVRFPALLNVQGDISEDEAYTLVALGIQAAVIAASKTKTTAQKQIKALREVLEKVYQADPDVPSLSAKMGMHAPGQS